MFPRDATFLCLHRRIWDVEVDHSTILRDVVQIDFRDAGDAVPLLAQLITTVIAIDADANLLLWLLLRLRHRRASLQSQVIIY